MTQANHVPNDPIAQLWRIARAWIADAVHAFGAPAEVARTLSRFARAGLARRLRALETLVLKLLLVEAARLPPPRATYARTRAAAVHVARARPAPDPERPETWRVRFQLPTGAHDDHAARPAPPARAIAPRAASSAHARAKAEKLARRLEALIRVAADPAPHARRLRRKLAALGQRAYDAAMRIAIRQPPHNQLDQTLHSRAQFAACAAAPALADAPDTS